jgi:hypothetical protein
MARFRRTRLRTIYVAVLDRQMAEVQAIARATTSGAQWATVRSSERIVDPDSGVPVWEIVEAVSRRRR